MESENTKKQIHRFLDEILILFPDLEKYSSEIETIKKYINAPSGIHVNKLTTILNALTDRKEQDFIIDNADLHWLLSDLIETHSTFDSNTEKKNNDIKKTYNYTDEITWTINNSGKVIESNAAFDHLFLGNNKTSNSPYFIDLIQGTDQINFWTEQVKTVFSKEYHFFKTTFLKFNFKTELYCIGKLNSNSTNSLYVTFKAKIVSSEKDKIETSPFYHELEKLTGKISNSFLNTEYAFLDHLKEQALEAVSNLIEASSASIYYFKESNRIYYNKFNWQLKPNTFKFPIFESISSTDFSEEEKILAENGIVFITKSNSNRKYTVINNHLFEKSPFFSYMLLPLKLNQKLCGFIEFNFEKASGKITNSNINLMQKVSDMFSGACSRQYIEESLRSRNTQLEYFSESLKQIHLLNIHPTTPQESIIEDYLKTILKITGANNGMFVEQKNDKSIIQINTGINPFSGSFQEFLDKYKILNFSNDSTMFKRFSLNQENEDILVYPLNPAGLGKPNYSIFAYDFSVNEEKISNPFRNELFELLAKKLEKDLALRMAWDETRIQAIEIADLARLPEESPLSIFRSTIQGKILYINPSAKGEFNITSVEPLPNELFPFLTQESYDNSNPKIIIKSGKPFEVFSTYVEEKEYFNFYLKDISAEVTERHNRIRIETAHTEVLSLVSEAVIRLTNDLIIAFTNPAWEIITRFPKDETIGKSLLDYIHPEDIQLLNDNIKKLNYGLINEVKFRIRVHQKESGYIIAALSIKSGIQSIEQKPEFVASFFDITAQAKAEDAIQKSEKYFRSIISNSSDIILVIERKGKIRFSSPSAEKVFPKSFFPIEGKNLSIFFKRRDIEKAKREILNAFLTGITDLNFEFKVQFENESERVFEIKANILLDQDPVNGILLTARDITERIKNLEALRESREMMEMILNNAPVGVFAIRNDQSLFFSSGNILKQLSNRFAKPEEMDFKNSYLSRLFNLEINNANTGVTSIKTLKINESTFEFYFNPLKDKFNQTSGCLVVVVDITEKISAIEAQSGILKDLEAANQNLKDFAHIVSHDLKAPLRAMHTLTEWIETDYGSALPPEGNSNLTLLKNRIEHMYNLIEGILEYSRVGRVKEKNTLFNLGEMISDLVKMLSAPENISVIIPDNMPVIYGEKIRFQQIFQNLITNSINFSNKTEGKIEIKWTENEVFYQFAVKDNGAGIDPKNKDRIFQIFNTFSTGEKNPGTGIGLTIVKKIVEIYGGKIIVESELNKGSEFIFTIDKQKVTAVMA